MPSASATALTRSRSFFARSASAPATRSSRLHCRPRTPPRDRHGGRPSGLRRYRPRTIDARSSAPRSGRLPIATAALLPVHLYGQPADMPAFAALAERKGLALVEDCCQAHLATCAGRAVGTFGAAGAFSFYPTKNLGALGDGGAVITGDASLAARIARLRNGGQADRYRHVEIGVNSRLDEMQAAILRARLPHLRRRTDAAPRAAPPCIDRCLPARPSTCRRRWMRDTCIICFRSGRSAARRCRIAFARPASRRSCTTRRRFLSSRHSHRRSRPIARRPFAPRTKCCRCPYTQDCRQTPSPRSLTPFERNHPRESVNYRRGRIHRIASRRGTARCGPRGRHHRQPVDRFHPQHRTSEVESAVQVRHRHAHQRAAARRAHRSQRRHLSFRRRGRREADRRTAGAHDRNQRARHRGRPEAREQEEERRSSSPRRRRCTARARTCRFAKTPIS